MREREDFKGQVETLMKPMGPRNINRGKITAQCLLQPRDVEKASRQGVQSEVPAVPRRGSRDAENE